MKIYICGKITGLPAKEVTKKFKDAALDIKRRGFEYVNPIELDHNHDKTWEGYMKECIAALVTCDAILLLNDYPNSKGAKIELDLAKVLNLKIFSQL